MRIAFSKIVLVILIPLLNFSSFSFGQAVDDSINYLPATPLIGWDSLSKKIGYPDLARRAGLEGLIRVRVKFDSLGNIKRTENYSNANQYLFEHIDKALRVEKWSPAIKNGKPRWGTDYFKFLFYLDDQTPIMIRGDHRLILYRSTSAQPQKDEK